MDMLMRMRAFARVVEDGTFAAAARSLGVSRSALTKYVASLEAELDVQLLRRSTRQVTVTAAGRAFYDQAVGVLEQADAAMRSVSESRADLRGRLRVNAPMTFGAMHLADAVAEFMARHPQVEVELVLNDRFVDLIEEGFDVSVRVAAPDHQTSLILEPLAAAERVLCAAPAYLAKAPALAAPEHLRDHRCLFYGYQSSGSGWRLNGPDGVRSVAVRCVMWSNNGEVLRRAARAGQGITLLPTFIVGDDLDAGALQRVLPEWGLAPLTVHALYARHRSVSPRVRAFVAHLRAWFG
jgi:DNA-binding transcriptional LysR family regulator